MDKDLKGCGKQFITNDIPGKVELQCGEKLKFGIFFCEFCK